MNLMIRNAQKSDIPAVHIITQEAFEKYAHDLGLPKQVSALKETRETILAEMESKTVLIALLDDVPVGCIRYEMLPENIAYISRFGVKLDLHNCGVGKALVQAVEDRVRQLGASALSLHTASKMTALVRFYYGMGFYIHSTGFDRGYVRALFLKELKEVPLHLLDSVLSL